METDDPRFDRQIRFAPLGEAGQRRLEDARVLQVGCGALGGVLAQTMVRCGVGELSIVDRDVVEPTNLPRQVLFDDDHARRRVPKVEAALESLARIGGPTRVAGHCLHVDSDNLEELAEGADLILDGTDNLSTRYLINDGSLEWGVPWVYAGVVGSSGLAMPIVPGKGPCLRCLFPDAPPPGTLPTCDTAGVVLPAVGAVASLQAGLALRMLGSGAEAVVEDGSVPLHRVDVWSGDLRSLSVERQEDCPCCVGGDRSRLRASARRSAVVLCGRNAVQVRGGGERPDLERVAAGVDGLAQGMQRAGSLLRFRVESLQLTVFPDGRALVEGTEDADRARAVYDRYVGS